MEIRQKESTVKRLISIGKVFCLIGIVIPLTNLLICLYSEVFRVKLLNNVHVVINPFASILLVLLGLSLWLIREEGYSRTYQRVSHGLIILVLLSVLYKFLAYILQWDFQPENIILGLDGVENNPWNDKLSVTLIYFSFLSFSIYFIDATNRFLLKNSQFFNYVLILLAIVNIYGFIFRLEYLFQVQETLPVSLLAALTIYFLTSAVLFLRPYKGSMQWLIADRPTKSILIRFFALISPLIFGYLEILGERNGLYSQEFGKAILATFSFALTMGLLGAKAKIRYKGKLNTSKMIRRIKSQRKRLSRIIKYSPIMINILDLKKDEVIYSNNKEKELLENNDFEFKGKGFKEKLESVVHQEDRKKLRDSWEGLPKLDGKKFQDISYRLVNKKQEVTWLISRRITFKEENNEPRQIIMNALDITEEKEQLDLIKKQNEKISEINEELKESKDKLEIANSRLKEKARRRKNEKIDDGYRLRQFFENSFEPIARYDFDGIDSVDTGDSAIEIANLMFSKTYLADVNKLMVQLLKYDKPEKLIGMKLEELWVGSKTEKIGVLKKFAEKNFRQSELHMNLKCNDGSEISVVTNIMGVTLDQKLNGCWAVHKTI